jgi:cystathionine gamma-synthase
MSYNNMNANYPITTSSGTTAFLTTVRALIPAGATVLIARTTYYETAVRLKREAAWRNWTLSSFDPADRRAAMRAITSVSPHSPLVVWLDQPSNWWLEVTDLAFIASAVKVRDGIVIADISLHPLAPALSLGVDVAVASLSKYPSNGICLGGIILTDHDEIAERIFQQRSHDASALAAESAFAIIQQIVSLEDRFSAVSAKAQRLADFAKRLPGVQAVRYPNLDTLKTTTGGGVIVLHLADSGYGARAEEIIAQNFHRPDFPLTLACTFGGIRTTFEHFHPRGCSNDEVVGTLIEALPNNLCRIGVGCEDFGSIRDGLSLAFPNWP